MAPPTTFGTYVLERKLGAGAMGEVWKATDSRLARPVAVKLLTPSRLQDASARARFIRESRASSALNHPNIVTVYEAGEFDEQPFLAMELIEGQTLRDLLNQGHLDRVTALDVARQTLQGLAVAHAAGIIHRDVKPENLMIRKDGYVKILDFGLAEMLAAQASDSLTRSNTVLGTPLYMSPEQAMGKPLDERTDVYSFGTVLYEMLAGRPPFHSEIFYEILTALLEKDPPPLPGLPDNLQELLAKALQKDRDRRFRDARSMLEALLLVTSGPAEFPPASEEASLVVLPFTSAADDTEIADGITDEIITSLEKIDGLRVIARSTSMRYRGTGVDPRTAGKELNVGMALEGSMRRAGTRVRVTAGMIDTRSGFRVWGDRFESQMGDIFDLQDEIAGAIVRALKSRFAHLSSLARTEQVALDTQTNEHYLRGIHHLGHMTPQNVSQAVQSLEEAVRAQPAFAAAHARLAEALMYRMQMIPAPDAAAAKARALAEAEFALALDPGNPDALASLGLGALNDPGMDLPRAASYFRQALAASPNHVTALSWLSYVLTVQGHAAEAEQLARRALARDPQGSNHFMWLAFALVSQGRLEEAADAAERGLRLEQRHPFTLALLLVVDLWRGHTEDAARFAAFLEECGVENPVVHAALMVHRARAHGLLYGDLRGQDIAFFKLHLMAARVAAMIPAMAGEAAPAVAWLRTAWSRGDRNLGLLDVDPFLEPIRGSAEFQAHREDMRRALETCQEV